MNLDKEGNTARFAIHGRGFSLTVGSTLAVTGTSIMGVKKEQSNLSAHSATNELESESDTVRVTRGGHVPTGVSADRRAKSASRATKKSELTHQSLVQAARIVFERDGYMDARVSDIVAEAGVSHGSFYTYFPSKREVFQEVVQEVGNLIGEAAGHAPEDVPGDTVANLERANRRYLRVHRQNARILDLVDQVATVDTEVQKFRIAARMRHVRRIKRMITNLQDRDLADRDLDPHATAGALVAMLSSYAHWSRIEGRYDEDFLAKTLTQIWVRAIGLEESPARKS